MKTLQYKIIIPNWLLPVLIINRLLKSKHIDSWARKVIKNNSGII